MDDNAQVVATRPVSLLSIAKREAARKALYARLFRGPTLGPELSGVVEIEQVATTSKVTLDEVVVCSTGMTDEELSLKPRKDKKRKEKRCAEEDVPDVVVMEVKDRKTRSKEKEGDTERKWKRKGETSTPDNPTSGGAEDEKLERKRRKERKKMVKVKAADEDNDIADVDETMPDDAADENSEKRRRKEKRKLEKLESVGNLKCTDEADAGTQPRKSKKRKAEDLEQSDRNPTSVATGRLKDGEKKRKKDKTGKREEDDNR